MFHKSLLILCYFDARFLQHLRRQGVGIAVFEYNVLHARVDDHLGADAAWLIRAIERRAVNIRSMLGSLDNRILLGMETSADFVPLPGRDSPLFAETSAIETMLNTRRCAVIARGKNIPVLHDHGTNLAAKAGSPFLHQVGNLHEIFVP